MLSINVSHAKPFLSYPYEEVLCPRLERAQRELLNGGGKGDDFIGWVRLPAQYDRAEYARTVITASRFVGELEVCNASLIFTFSGSTLTTVTGTFLPPIDTSESGETALDAVTALVRFLDYRNASGAVCTGITWLSAGYLVQSTTSAPLQLVPVLRVDTDVYSYYVNIVSGEVSRVSA